MKFIFGCVILVFALWYGYYESNYSSLLIATVIIAAVFSVRSKGVQKLISKNQKTK